MSLRLDLVRFPAIGALAFGLALLPASAAQTAQTPPGSNPQAQHPGAMHGGAAGMGWEQARFDRISTLLNLTPDQQTKGKAIFQNAKQQAQPIVSQLRQNSTAIQDLVKSGNTSQFNAQITQLAQQQGNLVGQLVKIRANAYEQFYTTLSPEQRQKASDLYQLVTSERHMRWNMSPSESMSQPTD